MYTPDYFADLKNYLDITYDDSDADVKLSGICVRAEAYLRRVAGDPAIFFAADMEDQELLQLLFDCCRYIRSNALEDFAQNFHSELWALRANTHIQTEDAEEANADGA